MSFIYIYSFYSNFRPQMYNVEGNTLGIMPIHLYFLLGYNYCVIYMDLNKIFS